MRYIVTLLLLAPTARAQAPTQDKTLSRLADVLERMDARLAALEKRFTAPPTSDQMIAKIDAILARLEGRTTTDQESGQVTTWRTKKADDGGPDWYAGSDGYWYRQLPAMVYQRPTYYPIQTYAAPVFYGVSGGACAGGQCGAPVGFFRRR